MEIKNIDKKENKLLNRTEIIAEVHHSKGPTPKRLDLKRQIAAKVGANEDLLVIKKIEPTFGSKTLVYANVYPSVEELNKIEQKHIQKRLEKAKKKLESKAKKAAEAKPVEEAPKPAEEKKEEKKEPVEEKEGE